MTTATWSTPSLLWWRDDDGDLVDGLVDSLTDLVGGGAIWLLTPKVGRPNAVDPADIAEAAPIAGLSQTTTAAVSKDWSATRLVAPKTACLTSTSDTDSPPHGQGRRTTRLGRDASAARCSAESGIIRPYSPRSRWPGCGRRCKDWGTGPAGGFTALALRWPDRVGLDRRARAR